MAEVAVFNWNYWWNLHTCMEKPFNTLRPRQNGHHLADDIFKCIFLNENVWIPVKISLKYVPKGPINNIPALVQIMAWRRSGDKLLSEPMMFGLPTHICVTRPQWVNMASHVTDAESSALLLPCPIDIISYWQVLIIFHFNRFPMKFDPCVLIALNDVLIKLLIA